MKIIIAGAGAVGSHLAKMLSNERHDIVLIDPDEERLRTVGMNLDVLTLTGSATSIQQLTDADVKRADLFISVAKREETNITASVLAKRMGAKKTIARIDNQEYLLAGNREHFNEIGIDYMIYPEGIAAREIVGLLHQTAINDLVDFSGGKLQMFVIKLDENAPIIDKSLNDTIENVEDKDYRAVAITRESMTIIPDGNEKFKAGDSVYIIANQSSVKELSKLSGKEEFEIRNIMILGGSRIGIKTARDLGNHHYVKLIEADREKSYRISNSLNNTLVINGDGRDIDLLMEEGLNKMDAFIAVTGNSETNILSCLLAKRFGVKKTIAEIENMNYIHIAESIGIDTIINKKLITASRIFRFTMTQAVTSLKCLAGTDAEVMEFIAQPNSQATKDVLNKIPFPEESIVGGVIRGKTSFIAHGYTLIKPYDKVVVFALPSAIGKVGKFFS
jgi:trk system potassium uptake protein